ncbi:glycosyltransferase [Aestuariibius insulae]|uniref:glycosyltransferase n=1 Tax=Aestuariibius insulae TaxID=2058287 RepID=UPI00345E8C18
MEIFIAFPCRNAGKKALETVSAFIAAAARPERLRFTIVDDGSDVDAINDAALMSLRMSFGIPIAFKRIDWGGVNKARNAAVSLVQDDQILMTDCHCRPSPGFDIAIETYAKDNIVLALTTGDKTSSFLGYGCNLVVPFMGTHWIRTNPGHLAKVDVASSAGTVFTKALHDQIGGYDEGMLTYGAIEPEFSIRSWMCGIPICSMPDVAIFHKFKGSDAINEFFEENRTRMVHNAIRFGLLYLHEERVLQMLRYYASKFPENIEEAMEMIERSDVWQRRSDLCAQQAMTFDRLCYERRIFDHTGVPLWEPVVQVS